MAVLDSLDDCFHSKIPHQVGPFSVFRVQGAPATETSSSRTLPLSTSSPEHVNVDLDSGRGSHACVVHSIFPLDLDLPAIPPSLGLDPLCGTNSDESDPHFYQVSLPRSYNTDYYPVPAQATVDASEWLALSPLGESGDLELDTFWASECPAQPSDDQHIATSESDSQVSLPNGRKSPYWTSSEHSSAIERNQGSDLEVTIAAPCPIRHVDLLQTPAHQKELIHHWVTFVVENFTPLDPPDNTCRTRFLPVALSGLSSTSKESSLGIAMFHALCATAAHSFLQLKGPNDHYDKLAMKHGELALIHLRQNTADAATIIDENRPLAILGCILIFTVSGHKRTWRDLLMDGIEWCMKAKPLSQKLDTSTLAFFSQVFLGMVISGNVAVPDKALSLLDTIAGDDDYLGPQVGIDRRTQRNILKIRQMRTAKCPPDHRELEIFELNLYLDFPHVKQQGAMDVKAVGFMQHVANIFYYATLVFFKRAMLHCGPSEVQTLVEKALQDMEAVELSTRGQCGCTIVWPFVVLATECDTPQLRERMLAWFKVKRRHGFNTLDKAKELSMAAWEWRTVPGQEKAYWEDLPMRPEFDVLFF